jgi:hypothetical protein
VAFALTPDRFIAEGARLGGAIIAASGSLGASSFGARLASIDAASALGVIGGGANGLATSSGSSPGKIQPVTSVGQKHEI